jgi:hypothetical protein
MGAAVKGAYARTLGEAKERTVSEGEGNDRALLVAMPLRHLESAADLCRRDGSVVLPAGGPGGLHDMPPSSRVLVIPTDTGVEEVPAATWAATFEGRVGHREGEPWPRGLPPTWVDEHPDQVTVPREPPPPEDEDDDDDDDGLDPEGVGPQAFFRVRGLERLPRTEWVFANEVVPKQQRGGRTFVPRVPTIVTLPS